MDQIIEQARTVVEGEIDFEGQRFAEHINYGLLSLVGAVAFLAGFATQDIYKTLYIGLGGTAIAFVAISPPWPFFNKSPQPWLPAAKSTGGIPGVQIQIT